jgi:hypothetical protein
LSWPSLLSFFHERLVVMVISFLASLTSARFFSSFFSDSC